MDNPADAQLLDDGLGGAERLTPGASVLLGAQFAPIVAAEITLVLAEVAAGAEADM